MNAAEITLRQLGGMGRLKAMIGARDFGAADDGRTLRFKFPGSKVANFVQITLNAMDTYDVTFKKIGRLSRKTWTVPVTVTGTFDGIYNDGLMDLFEDHTGLYLTLTKRGQQ